MATNARRALGKPDARLRRSPTSEQVAEHIRQLIFDGELRAGDRIPQDAIAADLGVSRIPVREALIEMARDGLVVNEPHVGAFVGEFSPQVIRDHLEIVALLQGLAAERVAKRRDPEVLTRLDEINARVQSLTDPDAVDDAAVEFQRVVNASGGSSRLRAVLRALGRMLPRRFFVEIPGSVLAQKTHTARTLEAIQSRSSARVRQAFLDANRERADLIVAELERRGTFTTPAS
ncbi:MAG TPA: GntR family transcriptional regulator [Acidimicrobiales bacterium]|nr:GntR family transcriptional regulator [Acidimicrobiales bacterium]